MGNLLNSERKKLALVAFIIVLSLLLLFTAIFIFLPINAKSLSIFNILLFPTQENVEYYVSNFSRENNNQFDLSVAEETINIPVNFTEETGLKDPEYVKDYSYTIAGTSGNIKEVYYHFQISWLGKNITKRDLKSREFENPIPQRTFIGEKDPNEVKALIQRDFNSIIANLKTDNHSALKNFFHFYTVNEIDDKKVLENIEIKEITFNETALEGEGKLVAGKIKLSLKNCKKEIIENIIYNAEEKKWKLEDSSKFIDRLCIPQFTKDGGKFVGTCTDCIFFPANKTYGLRSDYIPPIEQFELQENAFIHKQIQNDLKDLFNDAKKADHSIIINSAYRSYENQRDTFEGWVQFEMNSGKDRVAAENAANSYSARPGFSEHQLGTALDIATDQCPAFGYGCDANENLWKWLFENAYKYGFALSYPKNKELLTGYVYEAWHYRWIGKTLAIEFKQVESTTTLQQFLFDKNLY